MSPTTLFPLTQCDSPHSRLSFSSGELCESESTLESSEVSDLGARPASVRAGTREGAEDDFRRRGPRLGAVRRLFRAFLSADVSLEEIERYTFCLGSGAGGHKAYEKRARSGGREGASAKAGGGVIDFAGVVMPCNRAGGASAGYLAGAPLCRSARHFRPLSRAEVRDLIALGRFACFPPDPHCSFCRFLTVSFAHEPTRRPRSL